MPYSIKKAGNKYCVIKDKDGKVLGTHSSKKAAQNQIRAIYANSKE